MSSFVQLGPEITADLSRALTREWLETNGLGGWASSTIAGAHTRRYHGLLVVATRPPVGRVVLLSRLEEKLLLEHETIDLSCNLFPGAVHPQGHCFLHSFALDPFPVFTYAAGEVRLRKHIAMVAGEATTLIVYELQRAPAPVTLELRPFFAGRDYHHLMRANQDIRREACFDQDVLKYQPYAGQPAIHLRVPGARFTAAPDWYYDFEYPREADRGLDFREDLFTCGVLYCSLAPGQTLGIIASTEDPQGRDAAVLLVQEAHRRARPLLPESLASEPLAAP